MLLCTWNSAGNIKCSGKFLTAHAHKALSRKYFQSFVSGSWTSHSCTCCLGQILNQIHFTLHRNTHTYGNNTLSLIDRCHCIRSQWKIKSIHDQQFHQLIHIRCITSLINHFPKSVFRIPCSCWFVHKIHTHVMTPPFYLLSAYLRSFLSTD